MTKRVKYLFSAIFGAVASVAAISCGKQLGNAVSGPETVGFYAGGSVSKTQINSDGLSVNWTKGDKVSLFARNSSGSWTLSGRRFDLYGGTGNDMAAFSAILEEPMAEDTYNYIVCYPLPQSVSGTTVSYSIPSTQNGLASGGVDLMVSEPATHGALSPLSPVEDHSDLRVRMKHLVHLLRYYLPEDTDGLNGEPVESVEVQMSVPVCGSVTYDITSPESTLSLSEGSGSFVLDLDRPIGASGPVARDYACAAVAPFTASDDDVMQVKLYSESWMGLTNEIHLGGRQFASGHATAVRLTVTDILPYYRLRFILGGNNIGEPVTKITLTAPSGCLFAAGGSNVYVYEPGGEIPVGTMLEFAFTDEALYRAFDAQTVQVAYDSDHVLVYQNVVPSTSSNHNCTLSLTAPYLLFEDFSGVSSFSSNDAYKTSSTGSMSAYSFMNGWSGGRIGAEAGSMVRLGCRRETGIYIEALYDSRMESAPIARLKSPVDLAVTFDYGGNGNGLSDSDILGQTVSVGYVTSTEAYSSGSTAGTYDDSSSIHIDASQYSSGDWTTPYHTTVIVPSVPSAETVRISWKSHMDSKPAFAGNSTSWCYLDNVKVQVAL